MTDESQRDLSETADSRSATSQAPEHYGEIPTDSLRMK